MSARGELDDRQHLFSAGGMLCAASSGKCDFGGIMDSERSRIVFEDVAQELSNPLRRYLERLVGSRAAADDLLQETLLKIARGLPGFEGRSSIKTWAFTIATRVATDHFRRPQSRAQMVEIDESGPTQVTDAEVDQRLVIDEMNSCVREVIDSLPEDYRTALVLHDLEGQTAAQVAEIAGCSLATAKIRIHRARGRLKQALNQECSFYRDEENVFRCDRKREC
jgi:RNA polymerase sigma-70 factor (ECF subfamily)